MVYYFIIMSILILYSDHTGIFVPYIASDDADTLDALFRANQTALARMVSFATSMIINKLTIARCSVC